MTRKLFIALALLVTVAMHVQGTPKEDVTITFAEWTAGMTLESRTPPGSFTKDGVTISIEQGAGYSAPYCSSGSYSYSNYFYVYSKNQISFSSNDIISGIDIELNYSSTTFTGTWSTGAMTVNKSTSSNKWVSWEGEGRDISVVVSSSFEITGFRLHFTEKPDVTVTFNDYNGSLIDSQTIPYATDATLPADPSRDGWVFLGWDGGDWQNVKAATTLTAVYRPANLWTSLGSDRSNATTSGFSKDGIVFAFDQGTGSQAPKIYAGSTGGVTLSEGNTMTITSSDTLLALDFGVYRDNYSYYKYIVNFMSFSSGRLFMGNDGHLYWLGETDNLVVTLGSGIISTLTYNSINFSNFGMPTLDIYTSGVNYNKFVNGIKLPASYAFYDFEGTGSKLFTVATKNTVIRYNDYAHDFVSVDTIDYAPAARYIGDVRHYADWNSDGQTDIVLYYKGDKYSKLTTELLTNTGSSFEATENGWLVLGLDINQDGRIDYLYFNGSQNFIRYRQPDGSYHEEYMQLMTPDEFTATFDVNQWQSTEAGSWNGLMPKPAADKFLQLTGGALGGFGCYNCTPAQRVLPSKAVDINADGLIDLVDETNGLIYLNMSNGQWVYINIEGKITLADFTGNGFQDILIPGDDTKLLLYNEANGDYTETTLFSDLPTDEQAYAYDFDRDGDVDILVTFSSPTNNTGYAYTMFFRNNGNGQFSQVEEQGYDEKLLFSNLQDIDGDGYYDLLAFDLLHYSELGTEYYYWSGKTLWLKGQSDLTFAAPQELFEQEGSTGFFDSKESSSKRINAEDLNNDGFVDIWVSGVYRGTNSDKYTNIYGMNAQAVANTAPTAPAKPSLIYEDGVLAIEWGNGSDMQTMPGDLTYALRIGTTSGGEEILVSHANADGTRRNFEEGNMGRKHSYIIDLRTYAPTTIYVAVQAIDAQHMGSPWSQEASIAHTALPASFTLSDKVLNLNDTLGINFTQMPDGYTHTWQIEDGSLLSTLSTSSSESVLFATGGEKRITHTLTAPDGLAATYSTTVTVNPAGVKEIALGTNGSVLFDTPYDYNFDGLLDGIYNNTAIYKSDADFNFTAQSGIWNSNLSIGSPMWVDWTHNGAADLIFHSGSDVYYLPHNGTSTFTSKQADENVRVLYNGSTTYYDLIPPIDFTHNGNYDVLQVTNTNAAAQSPAMTDCWMMTRGADGSFSRLNISGSISDMSTLYNVFHMSANYSGYVNAIRMAYHDIDHNGFMDIAYIQTRYENNTAVAFDNVVVYLNGGSGHFDELVIPFEQELSARSKTNDLNSAQWVDMNADGYLDIVAYNNSGTPYILYNQANTSFAAPQALPLGELQGYYKTEGNLFIADIDNNGYPDVVTVQEYSSSDQAYGIYVHYFDAEGVMAQGFLLAKTYKTLLYNNNRLYIYSGDMNLYEVVSQANERPSAPTGIRAVQTDEGLLIEWNAADDDHTPAALMEYNLSVKHAGQTGANAYVISPQNAGNANAAYLPNFRYINATQYLIPMSALTVGDYEIQLQAVDGQKRMSTFSPTLTIHLDRQLIEAPTKACVATDVTVSYAGTSQSGTPVWDFDGAVVVSGSGFGPYIVQWTTSGNKTIRLTLNGETTERMIYIDQVQAENFALPQYLFEGKSTTLTMPKNMSAAWALYIDGMRSPVTARGINSIDKRMVIDNGVITVNPAQPVGKQAADPLGDHMLTLELTLTNANGCTETMQQVIAILDDSNLPQISLVTPDANGHNVISWQPTLSGIYPQLRVLKETNVYGQFVELATVSTLTGSYTDNTSNSAQRAERYAVIGIMSEGTVTPMSAIHQTVHMAINRGIQDNTFNLIWNSYQGAEIATYNILRGSSETALTQIASVSATNISYTDYAPTDAQPYYAIEYVLSSAAGAPAKVRSHANTVSLTGRSNVVNREASRTITYITSLAIRSVNGSYATSADEPALWLYAEVSPTSATYKSVVWEITSGDEFASIDRTTGLLTAKNPNAGGTVTVKATATDGSGVTTTRTISIAAIQGGEIPEPTYYTIRFLNYDGTELQSSQVLEGAMPAYNGATPARPEDANYTYTFNGWSPTIVAAVADADYTAQFTATEKTVTPPQPTYYTIRFLNYDGTELQSSQVKEGEIPTYSGATPVRPEDEQYTYSFSGWSPAVVAAAADADYTAQFTATEKPQPKDYTPTGLIATQEGYIVWLDWTAVEGVSLYEWEFLNFGNSVGGNITSELYGGLNFEGTPAGEYPLVCRVRSLDASQAPISEWASVDFTLVIEDGQGIEDVDADTPTKARKILFNGQIFILRGEKTYTIDGRKVR